MIKAEGRIVVPSIAASRAIQEKLFAMGYGWSPRKIKCVQQEAKSYPIGWKGGNITYASGGIEDLSFCDPIHTLADFNLDEDGNELPTFGNLKFCDPNPFVAGMDVTCEGVLGKVFEADEGPRIRAEFEDCKTGWFGFMTDGEQYELGGKSINDIFPINRPAQPTPHKYEFGDKVKTHTSQTKPRYWIGSVGIITYTASLDPKLYDFMAVGISSVNVTPWPAPKTFQITPNRHAIAEAGTVTFDSITLTIEQLENALAQAKKSL